MGKENPRLEVGTQFGNWTILSFVKRMSQTNRHSGYMCKCICGNIGKVNGYDLKTGHSTSCGCIATGKLVALCTKPLHESIYYALYRNYVKQASLRDYTFDLTLDEFKVYLQQNCHYCDSPPYNTFKSGVRRYNGIETFKYTGIDRKINSLGYTMDNCVPCCKRCNFSKKDFDYSEWVEWIDKVYTNLHKRKSNDYPERE